MKRYFVQQITPSLSFLHNNKNIPNPVLEHIINNHHVPEVKIIKKENLLLLTTPDMPENQICISHVYFEPDTFTKVMRNDDNEVHLNDSEVNYINALSMYPYKGTLLSKNKIAINNGVVFKVMNLTTGGNWSHQITGEILLIEVDESKLPIPIDKFLTIVSYQMQIQYGITKLQILNLPNFVTATDEIFKKYRQANDKGFNAFTKQIQQSIISPKLQQLYDGFGELMNLWENSIE